MPQVNAPKILHINELYKTRIQTLGARQGYKSKAYFMPFRGHRQDNRQDNRQDKDTKVKTPVFDRISFPYLSIIRCGQTTTLLQNPPTTTYFNKKCKIKLRICWQFPQKLLILPTNQKDTSVSSKNFNLKEQNEYGQRIKL